MNTRLLAFTLVGLASLAHAQAKKTDPVEVRFLDDTSLKMILLDDSIDVSTPYGKLTIPMADVRVIEFGLRLSDEESKRLTTALDELAHPDPKRAQEASSTLVQMREKAYGSVQKAARSPNKELASRAEETLAKMRESSTDEKLNVPMSDSVQTDEMKVSGRINTVSLRVKTFQFGEQQLKVSDIRQIRAGQAEEIDPGTVQNDPGHLGGIRQPAGTTLFFRVTGAAPGSGGVYGTNIYTVDSNLAAASVHSGVLKSGQPGVVQVTLMGPVAAFTASAQNGINSSGYGMYPGYRIARAGGK